MDGDIYDGRDTYKLNNEAWFSERGKCIQCIGINLVHHTTVAEATAIALVVKLLNSAILAAIIFTSPSISWMLNIAFERRVIIVSLGPRSRIYDLADFFAN